MKILWPYFAEKKIFFSSGTHRESKINLVEKTSSLLTEQKFIAIKLWSTDVVFVKVENVTAHNQQQLNEETFK